MSPRMGQASSFLPEGLVDTFLLCLASPTSLLLQSTAGQSASSLQSAVAQPASTTSRHHCKTGTSAQVIAAEDLLDASVSASAEGLLDASASALVEALLDTSASNEGLLAASAPASAEDQLDTSVSTDQPSPLSLSEYPPITLLLPPVPEFREGFGSELLQSPGSGGFENKLPQSPAVPALLSRAPLQVQVSCGFKSPELLCWFKSPFRTLGQSPEEVLHCRSPDRGPQRTRAKPQTSFFVGSPGSPGSLKSA
ncbi:hypothetical protein CRENBAI_002104 [Crenichthys baileyi]|uniref:Uncharacterized protein n=1 Tax=Crenichthys baileyi TaxID=28760 RepID=A0AAV9QUT7_9TELE